ncbi:hypothetical protein [Leifsonia sp. AG29]|uniref:hypothetical protein n=1 Tax=Leifsonia sp. AG29 TaxID=2598860 RepID=UPI00131C3F09|nr:hypothetical protein [Leifsonia sp. AG29]
MVGRIVNGILLVVAGVVLGGIGTVAHQLTPGPRVGFPIGLTGSLLAFTAILAGLRLLSSTRLNALLFALGTIAIVLVLAQQSPGGSVLIPANLLGQLWLAGPILIAAVVVAWPDVPSRRSAAAGERGASGPAGTA